LVLIEPGQFTLIVLVSLVFILVFTFSSWWTGRNRRGLILALVSAAIVSGLVYIGLILAIVYSALGDSLMAAIMIS
jgi:hypothetical protein